MKEFKGTKGEWKVESTSINLETQIFCGKIRIAQVKHFNNGEEGSENTFKNDPLEKEGKANAKLTSAAPELLKALQDLVRYCKENKLGAELELSEQAINKALN
jgi:hypothetical protein